MELGGLNASCAQILHMLFSKILESRHIKSKYSEHQSRQTQISILCSTLSTFTDNCATGKTNLAKYLIRSEQPFSMAEDEAFTY